MKTIHIFCGIDRLEDPARIDLTGQGQLHQYTVNVIAAIQVANKLQNLAGGNALRRRKEPAPQPKLLACSDLTSNVNLIGGSNAAVIASEAPPGSGRDTSSD